MTVGPAPIETRLDRLTATLDQVHSRLGEILESRQREPREDGVADLLERVARDVRDFPAVARDVSARLDAIELMQMRLLEATAARPASGGLASVAPEPETPSPLPAQETRGWEDVIFGPELGCRSDLTADRTRLIQEALAQDPAALGLVGQLVLLRAASPDKFAQSVRDVGEAYYRWQPKTGPSGDPFEQALADWLIQYGEALGVRHRIELVNPGSRFNMAQHRAAGKGVEIVQVLGWLILRDDGSVYQKAGVVVR